MRAIKVTYRAVFQQPIGLLNPMELNCPGNFPVEILGAGERWQARAFFSATVYNKLGHCTTLDQMKGEVQMCFDRCIQTWQIWGTPPDEKQERMLTTEEIVRSDGKAFFRQAEDYTHIIHAQSIPPGTRIPPAACGVQVNAKCFISTKANVEPSCKGCAEVWRREYRGK